MTSYLPTHAPASRWVDRAHMRGADREDLSKISVSPKSIEEVKSGRPRKDVHPESDGNIFLTSG